MLSNKNNISSFYTNFYGDLRFLKEIDSCYDHISSHLCLIDDLKDSDSLYKKIKHIEPDISVIKILLDTLWWNKADQKRFTLMKKYYKKIKNDVGDKISKLFDEEQLSIDTVLEDLFFHLWEKLHIIDKKQDSESDWEELDILFCAIEEEISNAYTAKELNKEDYMLWIDKLDQAKNYIKKIYI